MSHRPDSTRVIYLGNTASSISTYKRAGWDYARLADSEQSIATAVTAADGDKLIASWVTDITGITSWGAGDWVFNLFAKVDNASDSTGIKAIVYKRTAAGAETELFNGSITDVNDLTATMQTLTVTEAANSVNVTDKIVIKLYAFTNSVSTRTLTLYYLGIANQSRIIVPFDIPTVGDILKIISDNDGDGELDSIPAAGISKHPTITDNGDGSITVAGDGLYRLMDATSSIGSIKEYSISGSSFTLTNNSINYLIANYNSGTPVLQMITDVTLIDVLQTIPVNTYYRAGTELHSLSWDEYGVGLSERLMFRLIKTHRFEVESGLALGEAATRLVTVGEGIVWYGANDIHLDQVNSGTDEMFYYAYASGSWTSGSTTQYNNSAAGSGKYTVNWVYRGVEDEKHIYIAYDNVARNLAQAQASEQIANLPGVITAHCVLVGRIIVLTGASTATQIDKISIVTFGTSPVTDHNSLSGLQGGTTNEYYHLTAAEYGALTTNGLLLEDGTNYLIFE